MIIFIYGPDNYRSQLKLREIIEYYKKSHKSGVDLKTLDLKEKDPQSLKEEFFSASIFKEKKLLILKNTFLNKKFKDYFLKNYKSFIDLKNIILFYEEGDVPQNDSLFKFLNKYGKSQEFKVLGGQILKNWVKEEFNKHNVDTEKGVIEKIIDYAGANSWVLSNEIKKIASYAGAGVLKKDNKKNRKEIKIQDVELLVKPVIETDIFRTIDAIAQKNKKQALKLIHQHLERGDSPFYLLSMMIFQFRNLTIVKNLIEKNKPYYSILKLSKLHPFIVKKSYFQSREFTSQELKKIYQKVFQADLAIKKGKIEPEAALDSLILEL